MTRHTFSCLIGGFFCAASACAKEDPKPALETCPVYLFVLGVAQDAGKPQIANPADPAWQDPSQRRLATSMALIDQRTTDVNRWLFEATPDITEQLHHIDEIAPTGRKIGLDGIFLTHAHIGHYAGLMFLGHEGASAQNLPLYVMPRMAAYLSENGPWSQLVNYNNVDFIILIDGEAEQIAPSIRVTPLSVPHRQEFSEVVGFIIEGPNKSVLFLPDIDSWEEWDIAGTRIENVINAVDVAYIDATFFANGEIPGRDMSGFPHPFVSQSMTRFDDLPDTEKSKIRFIHMNHTNPLHVSDGEERASVERAGFRIAAEKETICI